MSLLTASKMKFLDLLLDRAGDVLSFFLRVSILLLTAAVVISCGIPTEAYLYAPIRRTENINPGIMKFENSTENDADIFLGYMLIYRFYLSNNIPAAANDDDAWNDIGEGFFTKSVLNSYDKEDERGYYSTSYNYSLFKVLEIPSGNRSNNFIVTLDFSDLGGENTFGNILGSDFDLRRSFMREELGDKEWIEDIEGERIFFSQQAIDYNSTDTDLPQGVSIPGSEIVCAVWTVAYGFDIYDTFQNVYSKPVYLGNFNFTIIN
jgi:hypothetical protein